LIDLHLHSTESDGVHPPAEVVRRGASVGLSALALTDHDTMAGIPEAEAAAREAGLELVPGVEISLDHPTGTFHMIGLFVEPANEPLARALERLREGRDDRNRRLVERLGELGLPVGIEEVRRFATGEVVARPHFARALVSKGLVGSYKEAFDRWIGKGAPGYVDRYRLPVGDAIRRVHDAGGVAVLCHPYTLKLGEEPGGALQAFVVGLAEIGLDAIEVRCREPDPGREGPYRAIASAAGILESGGSDFHGGSHRDGGRGLGRAKLDLPVEMLEALRERARCRP